MQIQVDTLQRVVDEIDWSDLFDAKQTGPAAWVVGQLNLLDIPFDRDLTPDEVVKATRRLETADAEEEATVADVDQFMADAQAFLGQPNGNGANAAIQHSSVKAMMALVKVYRKRAAH